MPSWMRPSTSLPVSPQGRHRSFRWQVEHWVFSGAGLLAAQILAGRYPSIAVRVKSFRKTQTETVLHSPEAKGSIAAIRPRTHSRRRS